jgi:carbon monoxide dehydrogenase subunit G
MKFSGELAVAAPRDEVFDRIRDARFFASCINGVSNLEEIGADKYAALFETKVAFMKFKFQVEVEVTRAERPNVIEGKIEGKPLGIVGRLNATSSTTLSERDGETVISYSVEANLTGKLGSLGQPVLNAKAKEMEKQFMANLRTSFGLDGQGASA